MTQFLRDQASDSEEVDTPLMLDGTYLSRNFATLEPLTYSRHMFSYRAPLALAAGSFGSRLEIPLRFRPSAPERGVVPRGTLHERFHVPVGLEACA